MLEAGRKSRHEIEAEVDIGAGQACQWRRALEAERQEGINAFPGNGRARDEELS